MSNFTDYLRQCGISMIGCTEKGNVLPSQATLNQPICIVLGNEETGISNELLRKCDALVRIPMTGKTSSLNVSVASGIVLYEVSRQRIV